MLIVGDIGNSDTKICIINSRNKIIKKIIFPSKNVNSSYLKKKIPSSYFKKLDIDNSLFCSVVPKTFYLIKKYLKKYYKIRSIEIKDLKIEKIIKIKVNKKQIGSDRLVNAIAVMDRKKNHIILDFGTATTFDVVIKNVYHGGVIAPGVKLSLKTLVSNASLIPSMNLKKINKVIGVNTLGAVRSGFYWGYVGLIDNIIYLIKKETKRSFKLIITGGFSNLFTNSLKNKAFIDKDLTIKGLVKIAKISKLK